MNRLPALSAIAAAIAQSPNRDLLNRYRRDRKFRAAMICRTAASQGLLTSGGEGVHTRRSQILGCSNSAFRRHIESQWREGWSWENYGEAWELDHVVPLCSGTTEAEVFALGHFSNIRPLTPEENREKGGNPHEISPG